MRQHTPHGHLQGATKCQGGKALCARCLQGGDSHGETVMHEVHECPGAKKVWEIVARKWQATTGLSLDITTPSLGPRQVKVSSRSGYLLSREQSG